jgi:GNAT superfamily N-acetyltransferase
VKYTSPIPLQPTHNVETFDCVTHILNDWLKKRAYQNEVQGVSRTYVVCYENLVVGYYSLANGCVFHADAPGKVKRNMPNPIPAMILGRLAVDLNHQGKGIGIGLVQDAVKRTLQASEIAGIRVILVHALNDTAKQFYQEKCGFKVSPVNDLTLMVLLKDIKASLDFDESEL